MTFEMFGAGAFGLVIGFVAWHVFRAGEAFFGTKQLAAFIGALLCAYVVSVFPAGTSLFASYFVGLALGFFCTPLSRLVSPAIFLTTEAMNPDYKNNGGNFAYQMKYLDDKWPEVAHVIECALIRHKGTITQRHLFALPFNESGRHAALKRFARSHPERAVIKDGYWGFTLREDNLFHTNRSENQNPLGVNAQPVNQGGLLE